MNQAEYDYIFKILLIGNSAVGKSSLLMRFADDIFTDSFLPTIGVDFKIRTIQAAGSKVKLQMWDTAGQQKFRSVLPSYYKGTHGVLLVFDLTDKNTFNDLRNWMGEVDRHARQDVVKILIGNKKDIVNQRLANEKTAQLVVKSQDAKKYAESMGMIYLETSAKEGTNIQESFINLVIEMKKKFKNHNMSTVKKSTSIKDKPNVKKQQTCC